MPTSKKQKNKKTKKAAVGKNSKSKAVKAGKPKAKKTSAKKKPVSKKKARVKAAAPVENEKEKEIVIPISSNQPQEEIKENNFSSREELDRLIAADAASGSVIFGEVAEGEDGTAKEEPAPNDVIEPEDIYAEEETIYMSHGQEISLYRRVLLWTSVSLCAGVIGFGWFLTVGPNIGMGADGADYRPTSGDLEAAAEDIKSDLIELKGDVKDNMDKMNQEAEANIEEGDALETVVENIKSESTTDAVVSEEGRDIFSPPVEESQ